VDRDAGCPKQQPVVTLTDMAERMMFGRWDEMLVTTARACSPDATAVTYTTDGNPTEDTGVSMPNQAPDEQIADDVVYEDEAVDAARKPRPVKRREPVPEDEVVVDDAPADDEIPAVVVPKAHKAAPAQQATVGVAAPEVDVKKIVEDSAGATPYSVMLAIIAVVGGGAGWKFYQNYAKQKHDQAMKALEIEQAKAERQQNDHQACATKSAALTAQVEALSSKLSQVESRVSTIPDAPPDLGFSTKDFEKMDKRIKAVEKKLQPPKSNPSA
jgi:hypothetical protein